jgi:peptidoglycan/LPS O-acetylase OafA/YrhL
LSALTVSTPGDAPGGAPGGAGDPKAQKRESYYRPELDVVRFVAFSLVFIHHVTHRDAAGFGPNFRWAVPAAAFANACGFGVALFFTLSAYLICELLLREKDRSNRVNIRFFLIRRILRIWPLYFLGLAIGCAVAIQSHHSDDLLLFGACALMAGNWFFIFVHSTLNPMSVLWSISVEEQFYLFCPFAVGKLTRRGLYILCGVILVIANASLFFLGSHGADTDSTVWYNSLVMFQFFAVGILLSLILRGRLPSIPVWIRLGMQATAIVLWFIACYVFHAKQAGPSTSGLSLMSGYALAAIGCVLMFLGFLGLPAKLLPPGMIWLGKISYGLYVYHLLAITLVSDLPMAFATKGPIAFVLRIAAKLALTILLAAFSYKFFETRFLRLKKHFEVVESRPV